MDPRPSSIEPEGAFDGLQWSPILRGAVLDNVLTILAMVPITLHFAGDAAFGENEEAARQAMDAAMREPAFLLATFAVGAAITLYACYWAARRAGVLHVRHGGWTAVTSAVLGTFISLLLGGGSGGADTPLWYDALSLALMVPAGMAGGWLAAAVAARTGERSGPG